MRAFIDDDAFANHQVDYRIWRLRMQRVLDEKGVVLPMRSLHRTLSQTKEDIRLLGDDPADYRFFTIVRDPWDILRSAHRYMIKRGDFTPTCPFSPLAHSGVLNALQRVSLDRAEFTRVLRFETLSDDWGRLCVEFDLGGSIDLPHANSTAHIEVGRLRFPSSIVPGQASSSRMLRTLLMDYCKAFNYPIHPS